MSYFIFFFFSSRRRHTRSYGDWSSDVCSSDLDADTYGPQGVADELGDGGVHQVRRDLAGIEAVRVACLREEPLRLLRIIGIERRGPDELEGDRNDARRDLREAEVLRLIDGLAIDGVVGRQPHAPIRPGGLG